MSKKIQVLGMEIDNYTVREMMLLLEEYISTEGLNVVGLISTDLLLLASEQAEVKDWIVDLDMHMIGDTAILEVLKEDYGQQAGEIQRSELEEQFLKSLIRKKKNVYWIGETEQELHAFQGYIEKYYPDLNIAGFSAKKVEEDVDNIINDLNRAAPDVLIMSLSSPSQEKFVLQNRNRFNAKLCMCLGVRFKAKYSVKMKNSKIKSLIDQTLFKRKAMKYALDEKKSEDDEKKRG